MVKVGALIGSLITLAGGVFLILFFQIFTASAIEYTIDATNDYTWLLLEYYADIMNEGFNQMNLVIIAFYGGMAFAFFNHATSKKAILKIGSIISALGSIVLMIMWIFGMIYTDGYIGAIITFAVGNLIYFIGSITYRAYHKLGIITSLAMFGISGAVAFLGLTLSLNNYVATYPATAESYINTHLLLQQIQAGIIGVHMLLFSFSKSTVDSVDDNEMSVDSDSAFQSYVPDDMKKKKKKKKKEKPSEEIDFQF